MPLGAGIPSTDILPNPTLHRAMHQQPSSMDPRAAGGGVGHGPAHARRRSELDPGFGLLADGPKPRPLPRATPVTREAEGKITAMVFRLDITVHRRLCPRPRPRRRSPLRIGLSRRPFLALTLQHRAQVPVRSHRTEVVSDADDLSGRESCA